MKYAMRVSSDKSINHDHDHRWSVQRGGGGRAHASVRQLESVHVSAVASALLHYVISLQSDHRVKSAS